MCKTEVSWGCVFCLTVAVVCVHSLTTLLRAWKLTKACICYKCILFCHLNASPLNIWKQCILMLLSHSIFAVTKGITHSQIMSLTYCTNKTGKLSHTQTHPHNILNTSHVHVKTRYWHAHTYIRKGSTSPGAEILTPRLICLQTICHHLNLHRHFPFCTTTPKHTHTNTRTCSTQADSVHACVCACVCWCLYIYCVYFWFPSTRKRSAATWCIHVFSKHHINFVSLRL